MISIVIPVYRNTEAFIANLKNNLPFMKQCEVIVVNDYPEEDLTSALAPFPNIHLIQNKTNLGFGGAVNKGVAAAKGDFIVLFNSDVLLKDTSFTTAVSHFVKDTSLFAVSFAQMEADKSLHGKNRLFFQKGFIQHSKAYDVASGQTAWAEGGAAMIRKSMFDAIGGFDRLFSPFYWEDIDLSYRAWKRGWRVKFEQTINVIHHHETTISAFFSKSKVQEIAFRNQLLFIWGSLTDRKLLKDHVKALPLFLLTSLLNGKLTYVKGLFNALPHLSQCTSKRNRIIQTEVVSDTQILKILS